MNPRLLLTIFSLVMLTSVAAAEDSQPATGTGGAAAAEADSTSQIAPEKKALRFLLGAGLTFGGDTLGTMTYSDGSTDSISAGGTIMVYGGLDYRFDDRISLQGTVGFHFDSTKPATNGDVTFSRFPLELLVCYHASDAIRIGGGARFVNSPEITGTGIASGVNQTFNNTIGMIIEGEYLLDPSFGIKLRHVSETYHPTGNSTSIDGSHFGVLANFYF